MATPSRILKGSAAPQGRRIDAAVFDADCRVREMVDAAQAEARRIVADAEAARAGILDAARGAGRAEGLAQAAGTLAAAAAERDRILRDAEREVVTVALAVARKILGRELAGSPVAVVDLAAAALRGARTRREVVLRVSEADAAMIREAAGTLGAALVRAPLTIREDPSIAPGGAVVETEAGRIDARVDTQLAAVARAIEEALA